MFCWKETNTRIRNKQQLGTILDIYLEFNKHLEYKQWFVVRFFFSQYFAEKMAQTITWIVLY